MLFGRIAAKSTKLRQGATRLNREHKSLERDGRRMLKQLNALQDDTADPDYPGAVLARELTRFASNMPKHTEFEEKLMYAAGTQKLTEADSNALDAESPRTDPLQTNASKQYPLLNRYVIEGSEQTRVHPGNVGCYGRYSSRLRMGRMLAKRQITELVDLTSRTVRGMLPIPAIQPRKSWTVLSDFSEEFQESSSRWLSDWCEWRGGKRRKRQTK